MTNQTALFTPFTLNNGVEIKNRLAVAPMTHMASNDNTGAITDNERAFLQGRTTDFGLFITAGTTVSLEGKAFTGQPYAFDDSHLPSLTETADIIKAQGAKAILQIMHGGFQSPIKVSASAINDARALSSEVVYAVVNDFAKSAELALQAGFDGVEIHGANGYLIQQFFSRQSNLRDDEWGGDLAGRLKLPLEIIRKIHAVKEKHNRPDFIVGYRFSPEEPDENGLTMADTFDLLDNLVNEPLQYLHVSLHGFDNLARRGADTNRTRIEQIHARLNGKLPLMGVGSLTTGEKILNAINTGWAEFVAVGKAVLVNPNVATLLKAGKFDEIQTEIDPNTPEKYAYSPLLWQYQLQGAVGFLPPLKAQ